MSCFLLSYEAFLIIEVSYAQSSTINIQMILWIIFSVLLMQNHKHICHKSNFGKVLWTARRVLTSWLYLFNTIWYSSDENNPRCWRSLQRSYDLNIKVWTSRLAQSVWSRLHVSQGWITRLYISLTPQREMKASLPNIGPRCGFLSRDEMVLNSTASTKNGFKRCCFSSKKSKRRCLCLVF